jgi:hypothetical protein
MKLLLTALQICPRFLHGLFLVCLAVLGVKILILDDIPASSQKVYELGQMNVAILIGLLTGYIIYLFSAELPKAKEKRDKGKEVMEWAERAAHAITGFLQMLHYTNMSHHPLEENILKIETGTLVKVKQEFSLVTPTALAPMRNGFTNGTLAPQLNWLEAMVTHDEWSKDHLKKIWERYPFFDSDLSQLLIKIENSTHSHQMKGLRKLTIPFMQNGGTLQNTDLSTWADDYYEQYENARELLYYCTAFKALYGIK